MLLLLLLLGLVVQEVLAQQILVLMGVIQYLVPLLLLEAVVGDVSEAQVLVEKEVQVVVEVILPQEGH